MSKLAKIERDGPFDYTSFDKGTTGKLRYMAGAVQRGTKAHVMAILEVGEQIAQANELLAKYGKEGLFGKWVEDECGISRSTAYRYMAAFEKFGEHKTRLSHITAEALYYLAQDDANLEVVDSALTLSDKGVRVTKSVAEELVHLSQAETNEVTQTTQSEPESDEPEPDEEPATNKWQPPEGVKIYKDEFQVEELDKEYEVKAIAGLDPLFSKADELLGQVIRLADDIRDVKPNGVEHNQIFQALEAARYAFARWKKS